MRKEENKEEEERINGGEGQRRLHSRGMRRGYQRCVDKRNKPTKEEGRKLQKLKVEGRKVGRIEWEGEEKERKVKQ